MAPILFQISEKTGRSHIPTVHSHSSAPARSPRLQPIRMSPRQTAKALTSHTQPITGRNSRSESVVYLGRRGRRKP